MSSVPVDCSTSRRRWLAAACALLAFATCALAQPSSDGSPIARQMYGPALLAALRDGGFILFFRHTSTDFSQNDKQMTDGSDCSTQRNLTDQGRDEARAVGAAIRDLRVPIGDVLASPFCRTMETARLMFGRAVATPAVREAATEPSPASYAELRKLLATPVPKGENLVIVSHGNSYRGAAGGGYLAEGEAAVIEPRGADGFRVVARLPKEAWASLTPPR